MTCCAWETTELPADQAAALKLAGHAQDLLETVQVDSSRWQSLMRCRECGRFWCEQGLDSGQMTAFFVYPVHADDPVAWFATAARLDLPTDPGAWGLP